MPSAARCPGCGSPVGSDALVAAPGGPAAAECYERFTALLARSFQEGARRPHHQLLVDAYTAQHGGGSGRGQPQAVAVCLMTLSLVLERGVEATEGPRLHRRMAESGVAFARLTPPSFDGVVTAASVLEAPENRYTASLRAWAVAVWDAWAPEHPLVARWIGETLGDAESGGADDSGAPG